MRVDSGQQLAHEVHWARYTSVTWAKDSSGFAYNGYPQPSNPLQSAAANAELRLHNISLPQSKDVLLRSSPSNPAKRFGAYAVGRTGYVLWSIDATTVTYSWVQSLGMDVVEQPLISQPTTRSFPNFITERDGNLWMLTAADAPQGRIVRFPIEHPEPEHWIPIVAPGPDALVSAADAGGRLILEHLHNSSSHLSIVNLDGTAGADITLPGIGRVGSINSSPIQRRAYITYSSFTQPTEVMSIDSRTGVSANWRTPVLNFDPADFTTTEAMIPSKDGTLVHAFIVRGTKVRRSGSNPTLLWGYGGFNISLTPKFSPEWLAWVQTRGVFVYANIRGGGEYGADWHWAGTKLRKQNSFDDFIAIAEWLKVRRWTDTAHLAITGRSNGGLLIGAVMTQRPDLAAVAVPQVGVLDMLRYHQFTIGANWASDYGRSDESAEMFSALLNYSPVHNVRPGTVYPATLITTAERDDRVVPAHSYKFAAALQAANAGTRPIVIRIERDAGHGAGASRAQRVRQYSDLLAFIDANLGTAPVRPTPIFRTAP